MATLAMSERRVVAPMFVESGGEHPKNVTHSDVESAIMSRIKSESMGEIDGVLRVYYNLKAIPVGESCTTPEHQACPSKIRKVLRPSPSI